MRSGVGWMRTGGLGFAAMLVAAGCGDDVTPGIATSFGAPTGDTGDMSGGPVTTFTSTDTGADESGGGSGSTSVADSTGPGAECGNDMLEDGEECDGDDLAGEDCTSRGFDEGTLACDGGCNFDQSECVDWSCGDGELQGRESCDGDALDGQDCVSLGMGFDEGTLACDDQCDFDTSGCVTWSCGNDTVEGMEACDGADLAGETCTSQGFDDGVLACDAGCALDPSGCITWSCGDGLVTAGEDCDGAELDGQTCITQGFDEGTLACDGGCVFDTSGCITWICGNGMVEGPEQCDGADLDGNDCASIGFSGGTLACDAGCGFDTSACENWVCGNNVIEGMEVCDFLNMGGQTCVSQGFDDGMLACQVDCSGFDTAGCITWSCGDGLITGTEDCDGMDLDGETCASLGFTAGTLACDPATCAFDTSDCFECGDGVAEGFEQCDGADLSGETCASLGLGAGVLACAPNCTFNTGGCVPPQGGDCCFASGGAGCEEPTVEACVCAIDPTCCNPGGWDASCANDAEFSCGAVCGGCGNDVVDQASEVCDGTDLEGEDCVSLGFVGGTLSCEPGCSAFDTSACDSCGNGVVDPGEDCDGMNLGGEDCVSQGFAGGTLTCAAGCQFDYGMCDLPGVPFGSDGGYTGYELAPMVPTCDEISGTGTPTGLTDDDNVVVPIGFTFPFYGVDQVSANIQSNGTLRFGDALYLTYFNTCLPTATAPSDNTLYVFWDDLNPFAAGEVYYQTLGVPGDRRFVVQWDVPNYAGDTLDLMRFQAMLSEATGNIDVCYVDTVNAGNSGDLGAEATAGIQQSAAAALEYSCDTPDLVNGLQLLYVPN